MDKLNLTQTYHDTSLMYRWEHCRLVGLINKVYFIFVLSTLVIAGLIGFIVLAFVDTNDEYGCIMCDNTMVNVNWLQFLFFMIILLIIAIVLLKMVYVNNGLRSTDIPTDGKNVKTWLSYHIAFLILCVTSLGGLANENHAAKGSHFLFTVIQCIVLIIEINVVHKFNIESKISADRRNRSFEVSNDI